MPEINNVCVVIPAYNEEKHIGSVLKKLSDYGLDSLVVDDGSTDNTPTIASTYATKVIYSQKNKGKGAALRAAFDFLLKRDYTHFITMDADGQHDPEEIEAFLYNIPPGLDVIICGNRMWDPENMPPMRIFINRFFSKIVSFFCKKNVPDALCGYRLICKKVISRINLESDRFEIVPEILVKAADMGIEFKNVRISSIYKDETSHIRPLRDGYLFFRMLTRVISGRLKSGIK